MSKRVKALIEAAKNKGMTVEVVSHQGQHRLNFLPKHFKESFGKFENSMYTIADNILIGYNGGFWEYAVIKSGDEPPIEVPFVFFDSEEDELVKLRNPFSGDEVEMDQLLAGMMITIYACNLVDTQKAWEVVCDLTELAYDYAGKTNQTPQAFKMLD